MIGGNRAIQWGAKVNMARCKVKDNQANTLTHSSIPQQKQEGTLTRLLSWNLILEGNEPARNKSQNPNGIGIAEWQLAGAAVEQKFHTSEG